MSAAAVASTPFQRSFDNQRDFLVQENSDLKDALEQSRNELIDQRDKLNKKLGALLLRIQESDLAYFAICEDVDQWRTLQEKAVEDFDSVVEAAFREDGSRKLYTVDGNFGGQDFVLGQKKRNGREISIIQTIYEVTETE